MDDQLDLLDIPSFYQNVSGNFWVALLDGEVVGTIGLRDIGNQQGALRKMFVKETHRGKEQGASQLLEELIVFATSAQRTLDPLVIRYRASLTTCARLCLHGNHKFSLRFDLNRCLRTITPSTRVIRAGSLNNLPHRESRRLLVKALITTIVTAKSHIGTVFAVTCITRKECSCDGR